MRAGADNAAPALAEGKIEMSLAWDPHDLGPAKRKMDSVMTKMDDAQLMREIAQLNRKFEREEKACKFAAEKATNIREYADLRQCYLDAAEEFSLSNEEGKAGGVPSDMTSAPVERGEFRASGSLRLIIFWSILGAGIACLAGYMIARLVG